MKTVQQQRATDALGRVRELSTCSGAFRSSYRTYVDRLGPAIVMNGLGQALATERAAAGPKPKSAREKAHHELCVSLERWLCRKEGGVYPGCADLLQAITENPESHYLHAQAEALAWIEWHKKCCRASFPKGEEGAE